MSNKLTFDLRFIQTIVELAKKLNKETFEIRKVTDFQVFRKSHHVSKHEIELAGGWKVLMSKHFPRPRDLWEVSASRQVRQHKSKLDRAYGDREFFYDQFQKGLAKTLADCPLIIYKPNKLVRQLTEIKRMLFAQVADSHNGAHVLKPEVAGKNEYNWLVCARRHAYFAQAIAGYKLPHRGETSLRLGLNGDIMAGLIHNQEWFVDLLVNQFAGSLHVLVQFITFLSDKFNFVEIDCTTGNHARSVAKGSSGRALVQKYDSYETMLYLALRQVVERCCTNVKINIPMAPYAEFDLFGHSYLQTHGDTVFSMSNPGSKLDIGSLHAQVNKLNVSRENKPPLDVVMLGHYHTPTLQMTETGSFLLINGTIMGLDPFAQGIGFHGNAPAQLMFEATEEYALGDFRVEKLGAADGDASLDKIIIPFKGSIE